MEQADDYSSSEEPSRLSSSDDLHSQYQHPHLFHREIPVSIKSTGPGAELRWDGALSELSEVSVQSVRRGLGQSR